MLVDNDWHYLRYEDEVIEDSLFKEKKEAELYDEYVDFYFSPEWKTPIVVYYENIKVLDRSKFQDTSNDKVYRL